MDITGNPLIIDAADVAAAAVTVWAGNIHIHNIEFVNYVNDADVCIINRTNGKSIWAGNGASDLSTIRSGHIGTVNGIVIPIGGISNGSLRIFFK